MIRIVISRIGKIVPLANNPKKHYCVNSAFSFCLILSNNVRKFLTYHITVIMRYVFIKGFSLSNYVK